MSCMNDTYLCMFFEICSKDSHFDWDRDDIYEASIQGGATRLQICPRKTCSPDLNIGETSLALIQGQIYKPELLSFWISEMYIAKQSLEIQIRQFLKGVNSKNKIMLDSQPRRPRFHNISGVLSPSEWLDRCIVTVEVIITSRHLQALHPWQIFRRHFCGGFRRGFWSNSSKEV